MDMRLTVENSGERERLVWRPAAETAVADSGASASKPAGTGGTEGEGVTFADVLDAINPLQHLPIVGPIYRHLTGDQISPVASLVGSTIFGGPLGLMAAFANGAFSHDHGQDVGGTMLALVTGDSPATPAAPAATATQANAAEPKTPDAIAGGDAAPTAAAPNPAPAVAPAVTAPVQAAASQAAAPQILTPAAAGGIPVRGTSPAAGTPSPSQAAAGAAGGPGNGLIPPGATGTITKSGLPGPGSVTPAAALMLGQTAGLQDAMGQMDGMASVAAAQAQIDGKAPLTKGRLPDGSFALPQRTFNGTPRMPVATGPEAMMGENGPASRLIAAADRTASAPPTQIAPPVIAPAAIAPQQAGATAAAAPAKVSDAMARALDKYEAMVKSRKPSGSVDEQM